MSENSGLTLKQKAFCEEYLIDMNGTQACIRAGYSKKSSDAQASRMLKNVKVKAFLDKEIQKRSIRTGITADKVLQELAKIAFHDIRRMYNEDGTLIPIKDLDDDTASTISSFKTRIENKGEADYDVIEEYKRHDKVRTLELIGKHLGMFDAAKEDPSKPANNVDIIGYGVKTIEN